MNRKTVALPPFFYAGKPAGEGVKSPAWRLCAPTMRRKAKRFAIMIKFNIFMPYKSIKEIFRHILLKSKKSHKKSDFCTKI